MGAYILRRLLLMIPTMVGIMGISFLVIQFAPGGPVEQVIAQLTGQGDSASDRLSGANWITRKEMPMMPTMVGIISSRRLRI